MNEDYEVLTPDGEKKKKKKKGKAWKIILIILLSLIIAGLAFLGGKSIYNSLAPAYEENGFKGIIAEIFGIESSSKAVAIEADDQEETQPVKAQPAETPATAPEETPAPSKETKTAENELSAADLYEANVDTTVAITTSISQNYWGQTIHGAAKGSGFFISEDGYILTNYHVIEDSESVTVATYSGEEYSAVVIGCDSTNDIAILKIEGEGFHAATLGSSDELRVGDEVVAIGNPLGELTFSMTKGYVSALNRPVTLSSSQTLNLIQTDCAINSGNSGGALFNMKGEVVGITNAKYSSSSSSEASVEGICFAIPIDSVKTIVKSIIENGYVLKPYIGVSVGNLSDQTMLATGLSGGVLVGKIVEGEAAEEAGLQVNDIILKANGTEVTSSSDFVTIVGELEIGDELVLEIYRQGEFLELTVIVGSTQTSSEYEAPETSESTGTTGGGYGYGGSYGGGYGYGGSGGLNDIFGSLFGW